MDEVRVDTKPNHRPDQRVPDSAPRSRWKPIFWTGIVLILIAALGWWIHSRPAPGPPAGRFAFGGPMPVVVSASQKGDINITYNALGTVTPLSTVTVVTQINGQILEVGYKEGQEVKKGDFLAQIDPRPYQAALDQAIGTLDRDQAALGMARTDLARYQKLAAQNSIAQQQADDQQYTVHQDEGTVKFDQAQVDNARLNLAYCRIVAPAAGRIGLRLVDTGNYVQAGSSTSLAVITQLQPISVIFTVPEDEVPPVMKRLHDGAKLPVTAYDRSGAKKLADGTLSAVDSQIDTTTGTVKLRAEFANPDQTLFPNQFVNAKLLIDTLKDTTVIPTAAVQRGDPGTFVYLLKQDNTVTVQKVQLGPQDGERVAVTTGLSPGDKVVIDGADKLRDGAKVSVRPESGTPAAAAGAAGAQPPGAAPAAASSAPPAGSQPAPAPAPAAAQPAPAPAAPQPAAAPPANQAQPGAPRTGQ